MLEYLKRVFTKGLSRPFRLVGLSDPWEFVAAVSITCVSIFVAAISGGFWLAIGEVAGQARHGLAVAAVLGLLIPLHLIFVAPYLVYRELKSEVDRLRRQGGALPLTHQRAERLSFGQIAEAWAAESTGPPGAWSEDRILHELARAMWLGQFEDELGNTCLFRNQTRLRGADGYWQDERGRRVYRPDKITWNRHALLSVFVPVKNAPVLPPDRKLRTPSEDAAAWPDLRERVPWSDLAELPPTEYDQLFREVYIKELAINKEDFEHWATARGFPLPRFWFGEPGEGYRDP